MHARVSRFQGDPARVDGTTADANDAIVRAAEKIDGFRGVMVLADKSSGVTLGITLWETEQAMRASESAADEIRAKAAEGAGDDILSVERYEIVLDMRS